MRPVLFIENHDSFSWNVIDALPFARSDVVVVHSSEAKSHFDSVSAVVMGPGPTDPHRAGLVELIHDIAARGLPFLGICLGHQALGLAYGANIHRSLPAHGKRSDVLWTPHRLFPGIEGQLEAMRYHSLSLHDIKSPLCVVATMPDGTPMAIAHHTLPMAGIQFHPDSFATPLGRTILSSFFSRPHIDNPPVARPSPSTSNDWPSPLALSSLLQQRDFALLAPGFSESEDWTLVENLSAEAHGDACVWYAAAEWPASKARRLFGRARRVQLICDVEPEQIRAQLHDAHFHSGVKTIQEHIAAGDVYQVNLTVRATFTCSNGAALLATLCRTSTPRFAAWINASSVGEIVSASPELLFEKNDAWIHAEPMKGTAGAGMSEALLQSEKDKAELAMITDLVRDDFQPLCEPGSVTVTHERRIVNLPYATQTVADIEGRLLPAVGVDDIVARMHPGGSVTGAPREAAVEVINRLEPTPRGAYCGSLALERGNTTRCALLIRTAQRQGDHWMYGVGAGITWDSSAEHERAEIRLKLHALTRDITSG